MATALWSLLSSVVGGCLVLAGTFFSKRVEDRRAWLIRLQEAGGDLATSYLQEMAMINDARRAGTPKEAIPSTTYVIDRQKALGRFRTLPWSSQFEPHRQQMGRALDQLWVAWGKPDDEFEHVYKEARVSTADFMEAVGEHIRRRGAGK